MKQKKNSLSVFIVLGVLAIVAGAFYYIKPFGLNAPVVKNQSP